MCSSEEHHRAAAWLPIEQSAFWNRAAEHLLQAHGLGAQLQFIRLMGFGLSPLILHGIRLPKPLLPLKRYAFGGGVEFHHVALAGKPQLMGDHLQSPEDQRIAPPLPGRLVVGSAVEKAALHSPQVLLPLLLQMDQCPLPPAEREVLQTGEGEEVLRKINHPMRVQVMPAGSADSSTETV